MELWICELLWLRLLLQDLGCPRKQPIQLYCYKKAVGDIAHNPIQYDRTKHVEVDKFFIKEKLDEKIVEFPKIWSKDQLPDWSLDPHQGSLKMSIRKVLSQVGLGDIYV